MSDVDLELGVNTSEAERSLDAFKNKMTKFGAAIAAGFAAIKIGEFLSDGIKEAIEAEKSLAKLATQLKVTGEFSEAVVAEFDAFAGALERATNVSAEAVLEQTALAKSFGLSNEESKNLVAAATQLSAITGDDLSSSVDTLIKSYQGQTRQLSKVIGETATLTKEQLKSGAAIDLINSKYGGTAEAALNTYSGALAALERGFGDISEEIGKAIIGNDKLIGVIRAVTKSFEDIIDFLAANKGEINSFVSILVDGFFGAAKGVTYLASIIERVLGGAVVAVTVPLEGIIGAFQSLAKLGGTATEGLANGLEDANVFLKNFNDEAIKGVAKNTGAFAKLNEEIGDIEKSIKGMGKQVEKSGKQIDKATQGKKPFFTSQEISDAEREYKKLSDEIFEITASEVDKINKKRFEQIAAFELVASRLKLTDKQRYETLEAIDKAANKKITENQQTELDKRTKAQDEAAQKIQDQIAAIAANPATIIFDPKISANFKGSVEEVLAGVLSTVNIGADGKEGAENFIQGVFGAIGTAINPALGKVFEQYAALLQKEGDEIQKQLDEFIQALPEVSQKMIENLPNAFIGVLKALRSRDFWSALHEALRAFAEEIWNGGGWIQIIDAFKEELNTFFETMNRDFYNTFNKAGLDFSNAFKQAGTDVSNFFANTFGQFGTNFWNGGIKFINDFGLSISNFWKGIWSLLLDIGPAIQNAFANAIQMLWDGITAVFQPIFDVINSFIDAVTSVTGTGSGGYLGQIGGKVTAGLENLGVNMADGGVVPPGYPNDTYPAFLTSGETVTPPGKLPESSGNNDVMIALLAQILSKLSEPMTATATTEINGRAFADIILQLNRNNARLAV